MSALRWLAVLAFAALTSPGMEAQADTGVLRLL